MTDPTARDLISRLADELDRYRQLLTDDRREAHALATEARAYLAAEPQREPQGEGPSDQELLGMAAKATGYSRISPGEYECEGSAIEAYGSELIAFARAVLARWGRPAAQPVPVSERLPGAEDTLRRSDATTLSIARDDEWCWGQERSLLTNHAVARWRFMRVSSLEDEATHWLPHWAVPIPSNP